MRARRDFGASERRVNLFPLDAGAGVRAAGMKFYDRNSLRYGHSKYVR